MYNRTLHLVKHIKHLFKILIKVKLGLTASCSNILANKFNLKQFCSLLQFKVHNRNKNMRFRFSSLAYKYVFMRI